MEAHLVAACSDPDQFPEPGPVELAIAGRSNCGKSSLINALTGRKKLARTSSTPGRTRQVFFFSARFSGEAFYLVDLPGYGYARVSKRERASWAPLIGGYIERRATLRGLLLLIDIRRAAQAEELDLLQWARERDLEVLVVLTKADKLNKSQRFAAQQKMRKALDLARPPPAVSVDDGQAVTRLRQRIEQIVAPVNTRPLVIGLTGGIASGKSTVGRLLVERGAGLVDADQVARDIMCGEVLDRVVARFGEGVLTPDGALDRARLGEIVFGDVAARRDLEAITHPAIVALSLQRLQQLAAAGAPLVVYEAALLVETGRHEQMDRLVVVTADDEVRIARLAERDGLDRAAAEQRIAAQLSQEHKAELADYVIDNSGAIEQTRVEVERVWAALVGSRAETGQTR